MIISALFGTPLNDHLRYPDVGEREGPQARGRMSVGRVQGAQGAHVLEFSLRTLRWLLDRLGSEVAMLGRGLGVPFVGGHSLFKERGSGLAGPFEVL